jgi:lipopolysaccharide/colanic/teichoic acid biosynthesis glycosyltransferase
VSSRWPESRWKRAADALVAVIGGILISPVLATCALAVRLGDGPGILFRQVRIGRAGRPFTILKFRTMRTGTTGPLITASGDSRVTRVGHTLRRFKLDELPQLWNVVRGDMSLVGPRPELPVYVARQAEVFRRLGGMRPGITDWASLTFRDEEALMARHAAQPEFYTTVLLPRKLLLARLYRRHASPCLDLRLVLATIFAACRLEGLMSRMAGSTAGRAWDSLSPGTAGPQPTMKGSAPR